MNLVHIGFFWMITAHNSARCVAIEKNSMWFTEIFFEDISDECYLNAWRPQSGKI